MKGVCKWFNDQKGYGFLTPDEGSKDVFAHYSDIQSSGFKSLTEGERVEFEIVSTERGEKARNIKRLSAAPGK